MKKLKIFKLATISAILTGLIITFVSGVNAVTVMRCEQSDSYYGEGVGGGVQGNWDGSHITWGIWHTGRWLGNCQSYSGPLYWTTYRNGAVYSSGSTTGEYYDVTLTYGTWNSIGASCYSSFYDSRKGTFVHSISTQTIP